MSRLDAFEDKVGSAFDNAGGALFKSTLNPVQIMKRANKEMSREKLVSSGKQYAPTLYNVLVSEEDDRKLAGFYPTMAGEMETALKAQAANEGYVMDGTPLVRFIVDQSLKKGKFDVIAENVASSIVEQLRDEEMQRYGLASRTASSNAAAFKAGEGRANHHRASRPATDEYNGSYVSTPDQRDFERRANHQAEGDYNPERVIRETYGAFDDEDDDVLGALGNIPSPEEHSFSLGAAEANFGGGRHDVYEAHDVPDDDLPHAALTNVATGTRYPVDGYRVSIGRERSNDIVIRDANISRLHAEIIFEEDGWFLRDLGSTNGTYLNDDPIVDTELFDGDLITIGVTTLEFTIGR